MSTTTLTTACTRPSTLAGVLDDKGGLTAFLQSVVLWTVGEHDDLMNKLNLLVATGITSWRDVKPIVQEAERRRGKPEAESGTNVHSALVALVEGRDLSRVDPVLVRDAVAAAEAAEGLGIELLHPEDFLYTPGLPEPVAGSRDWLGKRADGSFITVDIKTSDALGKESYKGVSWGIQTAIYSRGLPYREKFARDRWGRPILDLSLVGTEDRDIDQARSVVIEVERGTGRVATHTLDIERGWELADLACRVRLARKLDLFL